MELKNLVNILKFGGRFIITDHEGNPKAVLMDYKEFEDLMVDKVAGELAQKLNNIEKVNREITQAQVADLREEVVREDFVSSDSVDLTIEPIEGNQAE